MADITNLIKTVRDLCSIDGISGQEHAVREYIINEITPYCDSVEVDPSGSIIAFKKGAKPASKKIMLSAHTDEVGLIVTSITETGDLKFATVGGIDPRVLCGKRFRCGEKRVLGIIGGDPIHSVKPDDRGKAMPIDSMKIDIGATTREEAEEYIRIGDMCCFDSECEFFGGSDKIKARALDDRAGCAVLIDILRSEVPYDVYCTFVTMEEVGLRGATCAAYNVNPDISIVIESTTAADIPGVEGEKQCCKVGGGAVISFMDNRTIYDRELFNLMLDIGAQENIAVQIKSMVAGGNDAGAIQQSRGGVRVAAISMPCRYLHAPASVIAVDDLCAVRSLAYSLMCRCAE